MTTNLKTVSLKGTHYQIGQQIGHLYRSWGKKEVWIPPIANESYSNQLEIYLQYFPLFIEYLKGIADSLGLNQEMVQKSYLTGFLSESIFEPHKCSTIALNTTSGVFVGRNYDWKVESETASRIFEFKFEDNSANNFVGISDMGTWQFKGNPDTSKHIVMIDDAWNNGLFICVNGAPDYQQGFGLSLPHAVQTIVEHTDNTKQAIKYLSDIPIATSAIFTIADRLGDLAIVEKHLNQSTKVIESNDKIIITNHYQHHDLVEFNKSIFEQVPFHSTFARFNYLNFFSHNSDAVKFDDLKSAMLKAPVIQNWRDEDVVTCWSLILNLSDRKYDITFNPLSKIQI